MPFTVSHVAAVLPLARRGWPLALPVLVAGSIGPDVPDYVPAPSGMRAATYSVVGALTLDVVLGAVALVVGVLVARPVGALAPSRLGPTLTGWTSRAFFSSGRGFLLWYAALVVGVATHLAWDSFTHKPGPLAIPWPELQAQLGPLAVYRWLELLSTVVGLAMVIVAATRSVRRTPTGTAPVSTVSPRTRRAVVIALALVTGVGAVVSAARAPSNLRDIATGFVTGGGTALVLALVVYSIAVRLWPRSEVSASRTAR